MLLDVITFSLRAVDLIFDTTADPQYLLIQECIKPPDGLKESVDIYIKKVSTSRYKDYMKPVM